MAEGFACAELKEKLPLSLPALELWGAWGRRLTLLPPVHMTRQWLMRLLQLEVTCIQHQPILQLAHATGMLHTGALINWLHADDYMCRVPAVVRRQPSLIVHCVQCMMIGKSL